MKLARICLLLLIVSALAWPTFAAHADGPKCSYNPDGSISCDDGGGGDDGDGGDPGDGGKTPAPTPVACTPGATMTVQRFIPDEFGTCSMYTALVDQCSGGLLDILSDEMEEGVACPGVGNPPVNHPCQPLIVTPSGVTCNGRGAKWEVRARVPFPETFLDVRPFPATLVRWPTAIRNGGQGSASGSGSVGYVSNGGGSPGNPAVGDWSDLTLTLNLNPAGPMRVILPYVGSFGLSDQGGTGAPTTFQWEVPSHPEAGGGPLAGSVSGMDELPGDFPLFVGSGRSPYRLFWELRYLEYEAIEGCVTGPGSGGDYDCGGGTGHTEIIGYEWRRHSSGGEIFPSEVANLPAHLAADLNGDGTPDAYWDFNLTLRRMDDAGSVENPTYRRSWNWGGTLYWGVREGQGQIGWPGGQ